LATVFEPGTPSGCRGIVFLSFNAALSTTSQVFSLPPHPPLDDADCEVVDDLSLRDIQDAESAKLLWIVDEASAAPITR